MKVVSARSIARMRPGQLLETISGIGPLTASALAASIGNARAFRSGRELAAWLDLVPRQHSSGSTPRLLGISKRGDTAYEHF
ncbi:transposase [Paraburkholderia unamae]|uniref:transposase n=1 Tax=Paraburkholderia unamae TaxID=219649 RepID=UPI003CCC7D6E